MRRLLLSVFIALISLSHILAQQSLSVSANAIGISDTEAGRFYYANRNEPPRAVEFKTQTVTASSFLAKINQYLNIPAEFSFVETESNTDHLGMRHRLLQQYYKGLPLEGMLYRVHEKDGFVTSANGKALRDIKLDMQVSLSEEQAFHLAVQYLQSKDSIFRSGKKLIVSKNFKFTPESFVIAYQFDIDVSFIAQWRISIDARNGQVLNKVSLVYSCEDEIEPPLPYGTGNGSTNYYGNKTIRVEKFPNGSSRLIGQTENGGMIGTYDFRNVSILSLLLFFEFHDVYEFYSPNTTYNSDYVKPAVSVQWAAEQVYEYYFNKHNRNSFDNNGSAIKSYVHVDQNLNNAFWTHNLLAFGDGSNNNPLVDLDVVAHELTHGVTQYEAALRYYYEPGALNESFSDILGKAVEFDTFGDTATWQMAKHYREGGMRDLSNPNLRDQPDTYAGDMWYTGAEDYGGVHINSGVQNFWFYLLCEGGAGVNDHQLSYTVNPVGMDAAVRIAYRNLTEYLSYNSDYFDSRIGSLLATADLYGKNSTIYQEVDKAWDAVGVIDEPIITSLEFYDITATTVKIKGNLLPRGDVVTYHFEYGTTPAFGSSSSTYQYTDKVEGIVTGLQSQTKYYLRLVATNENGNSFHSSEFTTISLAPLVEIKQTVDVTETTATLHGRINPNSLPASFYFEYGLTPSFGLVTPSYSMPDTTEFLDISAPVLNLQPRQTYYYRLVATNSFTSLGTGSVSFFTAAKPIITSYTPVTAPIDAEVTIAGLNFSSIPGNNLVSFGATRATVQSSSPTEIKVKVPAGASLGSISVLDAESGLVAESVREFVPTFTGGFEKGSLQLTVGLNEPNIWNTFVRDMDGDNKPDIVTIHYQGFSIFQNVNQGGDITSESFVRNTFNVTDLNGSDLAVIDLDGNGLNDLVARYADGLRIYPNFSVPGFIFFGTPVNLPMDDVFDLVYDDFDLDGHIDIGGTITLPGDSCMVTIFRNQNPKGSLSANNFDQRFVNALPYDAQFLTTGDLNNDGARDLIVGSNRRNFVATLTNNSHPGTFNFDETIVPDPTRGEWYIRYVSRDLNQDGWKDIISHSPYLTGNVAIMENKRSSSGIGFATPFVALGQHEAVIQTGDINGDGQVDLLAGLNNRRFIFLENKAVASEHLSNTSFQKFAEYGMALANGGSGTVEPKLIINDLNGDGRPEVINIYNYSFGPHDGYQMEIWQNSADNCLDPSLISLKVSNYTATIVLPSNTTLDQFEIEYASAYSNYWQEVSSTTLNLASGYSYKLRVRAKCHLLFTDYHTINFTTDCVDISSFSIGSIGIDNVSVSAYNLSSFEVQYSPAEKGEWQTLPQYASQITNLLPGTKYDVRFRGRCYTPTEFTYEQFTTLCPKLSALTVTDIIYNKAMVNWTSYYTGSAILEYSADNVAWTLIDETRTMFPLMPAKKYFVRGRMACADVNSDFIHTSFTTPCPQVSEVHVDAVTPFSAKINWVDESNTNSYVLTYSMADGGTTRTVETTSTFYKLDGLTPGTQYTVAVAPQCNMTKDFTSIIFNTVCYVPFNLSANDITHTSVKLTWNDNFSGMPYFIDYSISGSNVWLTAETAITHLTLTELRPGTEYEARVHINCLSDTAPYASLMFETDLYEETTFGPNPTESEITISPSKNLIGSRFIILDNAGRIVVNGKLLDYTINLSYFSAGIYTLKIDGEKPIKIVKR